MPLLRDDHPGQIVGERAGMMDQVPVELHLLRSLKGPCLSVLMALWLVKSPQNMRWLQRTTGYGDEAVQGALEVLAEYSLVMRCGRYAWQIASTAKQLPLAMQLPDGQAAADSGKSGLQPTESGRPNGSTKMTPEKPESLEGKWVVFDGTPEKPESDPGKTGVPRPSSSGYINTDNLTGEQILLPRADSGFPAGAGLDGLPELLAILDGHGIREPARSRLAGLAHANERLLRYHLRTAPNTGLAIHRIERNWRVPRDWPDEAAPLEDAPIEPEAPESEESQESDAEGVFRRGLAILKRCAGGGEYGVLVQLCAVDYDGRLLTLAAESQAQADAARRVERSLAAALEAAEGRRVEVEFTLTLPPG